MIFKALQLVRSSRDILAKKAYYENYVILKLRLGLEIMRILTAHFLVRPLTGHHARTYR